MVHTEQASEAGPDGPTAHTPGPWVVSDHASGVVTLAVVRPDRTHGYGCGSNFICDLNDGEYHEYSDGNEQVANARLIAAAPDLLEAAQKVLAQSGSNPQPEKAAQSYRGGFDVGYALASAHAAQFVRAAIAKATGQ